MVKYFRKKPIVIQAIQYNGKNESEISNFVGPNLMMIEEDFLGEHKFLYIDTLEGRLEISLNDYVIKGFKGEFYPCKPDIFEKTYDEIRWMTDRQIGLRI